MIKGRSIQDLVLELKRQEDVKRDFMAMPRVIQMELQNPEEGVYVPNLRIGKEGVFGINELAHDQIGAALKIPAPYYDRMRQEAPKLLESSVNTWLEQKKDKRFVRVLDNRVRAFLSNAYRVIDNLLVVGSALETLSAFPRLNLQSCEVTEERVYLAATTPDLAATIAGDVIHGGLRVTNSEVGQGLVKVETFFLVLKCSNGARGTDSFRRRHVGKRQLGEEESVEVFANDTVLADRKALALKIRDTVRAALTEEKFFETVKLLEGAASRELPAEAAAPTVVEVTKRFNLTKTEGEGVLAHLIAGGDLSQWGMTNAVTAVANDLKDYDRGYHIEGVGGKIAALTDFQWDTLVQIPKAA